MCYQPRPLARLITLTSSLIIPDITKTSSDNCLVFSVSTQGNIKHFLIKGVTLKAPLAQQLRLKTNEVFFKRANTKEETAMENQKNIKTDCKCGKFTNVLIVFHSLFFFLFTFTLVCHDTL